MSPDEMLIEVFRQNWLHARHVETQRLAFASIYAAIVGASLGLTFRDNPPLDQRALLMFILFVLSVFGLLATLKWNGEFHNHIKAIQRMIRDTRMDLKPFMGMPLDIQPKARWIFVSLYLLMGTTWISLCTWYWGLYLEPCYCRRMLLVSVVESVGLVTFILLVIFVWAYQEAVDEKVRERGSTDCPLTAPDRPNEK